MSESSTQTVGTSNEVPTKGSNVVWKRLFASREISVVVVLIVLCVLMAFTDARGSFYSNRNIHNIMQQVALLAIFAIGETLVIITGGIDLSLGSLIAFSGMTVALTLTKLSVSVVLFPAVIIGVLFTLAISFGIGSLHATLVHKVKLPPFVVTLASLLILRSQSLIMNNQLPISLSNFPPLLVLSFTTI